MLAYPLNIVGRASVRFDPKISETDLAGSFDLEPDQAVLPELCRVFIDEDREHVPIYDVDHLVATRDDMKLVPVIDLDVAAKLVAVAQERQKPRLFTFFGSDYLAAPRYDTA